MGQRADLAPAGCCPARTDRCAQRGVETTVVAADSVLSGWASETGGHVVVVGGSDTIVGGGLAGLAVDANRLASISGQATPIGSGSTAMPPACR